MSKLPRPYIPVEVRIAVIERQAGVSDEWKGWARAPECPGSRSVYLAFMIKQVFGEAKVHLDHDPALQNRKKIYRNGKIVGYDPPANDPAHLIYRGEHAHVIKTLVRGDGAQYSDAALARKNRRIARNRAGRPVQKIKSRGFR